MSKREYKYKANFACNVTYKIDKVTKKLSLASVDNLKTLLPSNYDKEDLLPFAGNACVINLINENHDGADTRAGLVIADRFANKYINIEHSEDKICGHSTNSAFTKFDLNYLAGGGSDIIERPSEDTLEPFNIAVGGFIYKNLYPQVAEKVVEAANPDDPNYLVVGLSWEVCFDSYYCALGSRYLKDAEIITDPAQCEELMKYHKSVSSEKHPSGKEVYRVIALTKNADGSYDEDSVIPMGNALTLSPAAAVAGVVVPDEELKSKSTASEHYINKCSCGTVISQCRCSGNKTVTIIDNGCADCKAKNKNISKTENNISQIKKNNVKTDKSAMKKLKSLSDLKALNDENVSEYSFANIANIVETAEDAVAKQKSVAEQIADEVKKYEASVKAKEQEAEKFKQDAIAAQEKTNVLEKELKELKDSFATLQAEAKKAEAAQKFNDRMDYFDGEYELTDEDRQLLANKLKDASDEKFEEIKSDWTVIAKAKNKKLMKDKQMQEDCAKKSKCSTDDKAVASKALDKTEENKDGKALNTVEAAETSLEKYKAAFDIETGFTLDFKKR